MEQPGQFSSLFLRIFTFNDLAFRSLGWRRQFQYFNFSRAGTKFTGIQPEI